MDFRTVIRPIEGQCGLVKHGSPILLMGSCFTDNIGACLRDDLFQVTVNPFGPVYNPLSVERCVSALCRCDIVDAAGLFESGGLFHSFLFHSRFSGVDAAETAAGMSRSILDASICLQSASLVVITLATTWVFFDKVSGLPVANCHKRPAGEFDRRCLSLDETVGALDRTIGMMREFNPQARILFTVSPLRYLNLGAHGNQLSKSTLLLAIDSVIERYGHDAAGYFPAYEVMMDDLRDYRFYAPDMKHPSQQAVEYIYQLFSRSYFDGETMAVAAEAASLTRRLRHVITASPSSSLAVNERKAREEAAAQLLCRYPKLNIAYERYLSTLVNNGI